MAYTIREITDAASLEIEFAFTSYDEHCRAEDWFQGGAQTIYEAEDAETPDAANKILLDAYNGADVDGVHVFWYIDGKAYKDHIKKPNVE